MSSAALMVVGFVIDRLAGIPYSVWSPHPAPCPVVTLRFDGEPSPDVRVLIFVNGWNLGQYGGDIGPQRDFALPAGILRTDGPNTLALAVVAESAGTVGAVSLAVAGNHWGGVRVHDVRSPAYGGSTP